MESSSVFPRCFFDFSSFSRESLPFFLKSIDASLKENPMQVSSPVMLVFLQPSTRTQMSFQRALQQLGMPSIVFPSGSSSQKKGESLEDTLKNLSWLSPRGIVLRADLKKEDVSWIKEINLPIVSAGWGEFSHPTQALQDAYTIFKKRNREFRKEKILFVGDTLFSRVLSSYREVFSLLGFEMKVCSPKNFCSKELESTSLEEGLSWATTVMGLRNQKGKKISNKKKFTLDGESLKHFSKDGLILHPGPVLWGEEFASEVMLDPRCLIEEQVRNGVPVRSAILKAIMNKQ